MLKQAQMELSESFRNRRWRAAQAVWRADREPARAAPQSSGSVAKPDASKPPMGSAMAWQAHVKRACICAYVYKEAPSALIVSGITLEIFNGTCHLSRGANCALRLNFQ